MVSILDKYEDRTFRIQDQTGFKDPISKKSYDELKFIFITLLRYTGSEATRICEEKGIVSIRGKPYSEIGIRKSAERFIIQYPEDARELFIEKTDRYHHDEPGDVDWIVFIISFAVKRIRGKDRFLRWALKHDLYNDGFPLFKEYFGLSESDREIND